MIRNLLVLICGIFSSFLLVGITTFIKLKLNVSPFYEFMSGNLRKFFEPDSRLLEKMIYIDIFITFPLITFLTGLITGLIARSKEYSIGIISIAPLYIIFFISDYSFHSIYALLSFSISVTFGVYISKAIKKKVS